MHYLLQPGFTVPDRFAYVIGGLCHCLGAILTRDRLAGPLTLLIHARLRRLQARFAALAARVEAGTSRPALARGAPRAARVGSPRLLPCGFGWLCRLMPEGNVYAGYLEEQVRTDDGFATLLAATPQAGGMLRALLWMMGRPVPQGLRLPAAPPREPAVRPAPVAGPDIPYREQPPGSHYPPSIWPTEARLKHAGARLARLARRRILPE